MRICKYCGKEFEPKQSRSVYCSRECQVRGFRQSRRTKVIKICEWCGMEFETEHRGTKYCSPSCKKDAAKKKQDILYLSKQKHYDPKPCLHCGQEFIPREKRQIYCSKECSSLHNRKDKVRMCQRCKVNPTLTPWDWYCPECKDIAKAEAKKKAQKKWLKTRSPYKKTYQHNKNEGIATPPPKPKEKLSPASQRWAKMSLTELDRELLYYKMDYGQSQVMAKNNTLPEDFGLRKKVK